MHYVCCLKRGLPWNWISACFVKPVFFNLLCVWIFAYLCYLSLKVKSFRESKHQMLQKDNSDLYSSTSSANMWWETEWWLITLERGQVYKMKRIGPRTEPWGTPHVRSEGEGFTSFTVIISVLPWRTTKQDHRYQKRFWGESEVSKAVLRSRGVRMEIDPESEAVRRSLEAQRIAISVLCFGW